MKIKKRREFSINHQEYLERKQNPLLRSGTLSHHRNRRIRPHHESNTSTKKRINNVHVKNYELDRTELRDLRKENVDHYSDD